MVSFIPDGTERIPPGILACIQTRRSGLLPEAASCIRPGPERYKISIYSQIDSQSHWLWGHVSYRVLAGKAGFTMSPRHQLSAARDGLR
jgi:hypothetical protein